MTGTFECTSAAHNSHKRYAMHQAPLRYPSTNLTQHVLMDKGPGSGSDLQRLQSALCLVRDGREAGIAGCGARGVDWGKKSFRGGAHNMAWSWHHPGQFVSQRVDPFVSLGRPGSPGQRAKRTRQSNLPSCLTPFLVAA